MAEVLDVEAVLRRVLVWLIERQVRLLDVQRTHIEMHGRCQWNKVALATVSRRSPPWPGCSGTANRTRSCPVSACPRPAPEQDYESHVGADRNDPGRLPRPPGQPEPGPHLASLLVLNGLRIRSWAPTSSISMPNGSRTQRGTAMAAMLRSRRPTYGEGDDLPTASGRRRPLISFTQRQGRRSEPAVRVPE